MTAPAFLITIDTEGDDLWSNPATIETRNARFLPRFQALCERHGLRPTWLTDYEMARDAGFQELARDALARGAAEVGMHLHPANTPPLTPLAGRPAPAGAYLVEYPEATLREKVRHMTGLLGETFGRPMRSHRAGRWALDARYARALVAEGYRVDASVTPHVSWESSRGASRGGVDYRGFPETPYFLDPDEIANPARSHAHGADGTDEGALLELPMTIRPHGPGSLRRMLEPGPRAPLWKRAARRWLRPVRWLRPDGRNLADLLALTDRCRTEGSPYAMFMLHSSELMAGGSPTFRTEASIERLYDHLEVLFESVAGSFEGQTLAEFHAGWIARGAAGAQAASS